MASPTPSRCSRWRSRWAPWPRSRGSGPSGMAPCSSGSRGSPFSRSRSPRRALGPRDPLRHGVAQRIVEERPPSHGGQEPIAQEHRHDPPREDRLRRHPGAEVEGPREARRKLARGDDEDQRDIAEAQADPYDHPPREEAEEELHPKGLGAVVGEREDEQEKRGESRQPIVPEQE